MSDEANCHHCQGVIVRDEDGLVCTGCAPEDSRRRAIRFVARDNARLRALVKEAETASGYQSYHGVTCPWCEAEPRSNETHVDCPAFNPDRSVK